MYTLVRVLFWCCLPLAVLSWWWGDAFVGHPYHPPALAEDPRQTPVQRPGFEASYHGVDYRVVPKYDYELTGMVVSYRYHDGERMLHRLWNDHLNVADVCVVWGRNLQGVDLNAFDFHNGQFTCNVRTRSSAQWRRFSMRELSNNHLLSDDPRLREQITDLRVGDIIRVRGWLAWYGEAGRGEAAMRGSSLSREDTGNGACETIYVREFERLASMPNTWRKVQPLAMAGLLLAVLGWVLGVGSGRFGHRRHLR